MSSHPMRTLAAGLEDSGADILGAGAALMALCPIGAQQPLVSDAVLATYADAARDDANRVLAMLDVAQGRKTRHQPTLDAAYNLINSLGGTFDANDLEARGFDRAIKAALTAIEGMSAEPDRGGKTRFVQVGDAAASAVMTGVAAGGGVTRLIPRMPAKGSDTGGATAPSGGGEAA